jgi:propionyl-CoA carboxylase alpha chain/3-methylcrotonyl-CoA carboxylase alpha subunit
MKMEHALTAPFDGEVESISVTVGDQVSEGVSLARLAAG